MRVVSVLPSATEIVWALGHGRELVGRSAECDYPREVRSLPVVMAPTHLDTEQPSRAIDERVRSVRAAGRSLYTLDIDRLRQLRPDLILTQDLCGVCSVTDREVADACSAAGVRPRIVSLTPRTLAEVYRTVETVGGALADESAGRTLAQALRARSAYPPGPARPRVAVVEWLDPPILAGLWTADIVRDGGGETVGPDPGAVGERTTWERIAELGADVVVLSPCSWSVDRTLRELGDPAIRRGVGALGRSTRTYVADEAYFSRPGPRLADGVDLVRSLVAGEPSGLPMPVERWHGRAGAVAA